MEINYDKLHYLYESWDSEEILASLNSNTLEPEAEDIARAVLLNRGIKSDSPSKHEASEQIIAGLTEHDLAKKLWKSHLVRICQLSFILPVWLPISHAIHRSGLVIGSLWMGLLAALLAYVGFKIGHVITKSICANDKKTYQEKRGSIWLLILSVLIMYFALFVFVEAILPAQNY